MYKAVDQRFRHVLEEAVCRKRYVKLQYFSEIHEFMTVMSVATDLVERNGEEFLKLATEEEIRLDRIVRLDEQVAPPFADVYDFSCDC